MNPDFQQLMREATRLTSEGRLKDATEAIQRALEARGKPGTTAAGASALDAEVIDVEAVVVPDDAAAPARAATGTATPTATATATATAADAPGTTQAQAPGPDTAAAPRAASARPAAGNFTAGRHTEAGLTREFKLYLPPTATHAGQPLVVMLHGCTQDPDDFAAGTHMNALASEQGFAVLYPAQARDANPSRCWNWFKRSHQKAGRGEPAVLAGMTRAVLAEHGLDARRVYVAGLSAGGAMAAVLGQAYPELFAAVGVHSGLAAGSAKDVMSAMSAMKDGAAASPGGSAGLPLIVFHAEDDATVTPRNAEHLLAAALAGRATEAAVETGTTPRGRRFTRTRHVAASGIALAEEWRVQGGGHAWAGGQSAGSYTDPAGPDASREMLRFFLEHPKAA